MQKIKTLLRLAALGLSQRQIALSCQIGQATVSEYLGQASQAGLKWPDVADWEEDRLAAALLPAPNPSVNWRKTDEPDFTAMRREIQTHKHLTLQLLWQEYRDQQPGGYSYSRYCGLYRNWLKRQDLVLRYEHRAGVLVVECWILAALRKRRFFSLHEVNQAIGELLIRLNERPFRKAAGTRRILFESLDKPALGPLPTERYQYGDWDTARVNLDYHIVFEEHFYSAPYRLVHEPVEVRASAGTVEIFHNGVRVASHARSSIPNKATTLDEHRSKSHQRHLHWTPSRMVEWGQKVGPLTAELMERIMAATTGIPRFHERDCSGASGSGDSRGTGQSQYAQAEK